MKWEVIVYCGRSREKLATIYCNAKDSTTARSIAARVARNHYQIKKRCQFSAKPWHPERDSELLRTGFVQQCQD